MKMKYSFGWVLLFVSLSFGVGHNALSGEVSNQIEIADNKLILEQYAEAKEIYQKIINSSEPSVVVAYAHYKLGTVYKRQSDPEMAKKEYKKGLLSLRKAGEANHQIGKYLAQAIRITE